MFLRSLLHKKNKKEGDCSTSPRKEDGGKASGIELGVKLKTGNLDGSYAETNESHSGILANFTGCRDQLNTEQGTPSQNGNQSFITTHQTPGTPAEEVEFLTPPSGSREPKTPSKKLFDGVVGQQGDGDYVDETPRKSLSQSTEEEPRSSMNTLPFGDEGVIVSDPDIDQLIQDVLTIVSRELMNELRNLQEDNASQVGIDPKKYVHPSDLLKCQSELGKRTSSLIGKEKHVRRHQLMESKSTISSVPFDFKNAPPLLDPVCDIKVSRDDPRGNPHQSMKHDEGKQDMNVQKDSEDGCGRVTGDDEIPSHTTKKLAESDRTSEKIRGHNEATGKDAGVNNKATFQDASVMEETQDSAFKTEQRGLSFKDADQEVQSSGIYQGVTEVRSKSRIGNVLACRFDENYGLNISSPASTEDRAEKAECTPFREISENFRPGYEEASITGMDPIDQNTLTDVTKQQNGANYFVSDPANEVSDSSYDVTFESFEVTDVSYESNNETDWSKLTDYCEQDDTTYDGDCEVFLPHFLEDFVITPCEDTDTEDGDDFSLEGTPRDLYVVKDGSTTPGKEGPREDESPNKEEEDDDSDPDMRAGSAAISASRFNGGLDEKTLDLTSSPTDESPPRRQSKEDNLEDMKKWVHIRQRYMAKALKCLREKLHSRAEKLEGSLKRETSGFKEKVLEAIEQEVKDLEEDELTEDVGEMFLMDNLLKSISDQQEVLSLSLRTTEERTSLMEMQLEQWEVGEEDRKQQIVSLREEVEDATARQRSLSAMLSEERRLKEALQLRLATLSQEKQQLLYNNVMLWEQTSQMELKQEHFQSVSAHERNELEEQMKALESELLELRSRKAGEPVKKISSESSCSVTSDQPQGVTPSKSENDGGAGFAPADYLTSHNGPQVPYGTPPQRYGNDVEYYSPVPYHYYHGQQRPNANNSGFPFAPPRFPPPFPRRSRPRGRGDRRINLRAYFDRLSPFYPPTWYPKQSREEAPSPRGRGGRPFRGRGYSRRGRGRGYSRGRRGNFKEEQRN
ncbi:hypothetical protein HOLleu_33090 [Holothuria leucospilota]|uniref:Uncharacterized protein n=1 Tax=Holothuria leucospilota TaxID=206669 RepID=A0A9Q0YS73_HOLLE|nr:hypothetical protein HOLleu_33090 [Holothuria leucospilota]